MDNRVIGFQHRIKETKEGKAHPSQVCILQGAQKPAYYELLTETDELDFILGRFPIAYRKPKEEEDLSVFLPRHIKWQKVKDDGDLNSFPDKLLRFEKQGKKDAVWFSVSGVPAEYDGLKQGDELVAILGGSGDRFSYTAGHVGDNIGAKVFRLPPFLLKEYRERKSRDKKEDALTVAEMFSENPSIFYELTLRDRELIRLKEAYIARTDAMKARIGCEQRLRQHTIGRIFVGEGMYPEGVIEDIYDEEKANNIIYKALMQEETIRERELVKIVNALDIYQKLFQPIEGVGPMIAVRLIVAIGDIRRFATPAKLKAYCGAHVLSDGRFPRRRNNELANWSNDARQALFLLGDQFNYRPNSVWGQRLLENKVHFRTQHPDVEVSNGKKKYTDAHTLRMATWRTLTNFVEWLWAAWWEIEKQA